MYMYVYLYMYVYIYIYTLSYPTMKSPVVVAKLEEGRTHFVSRSHFTHSVQPQGRNMESRKGTQGRNTE